MPAKMSQNVQARLIEAVEHWNAERHNADVKQGYNPSNHRLEIDWKGSKYIRIVDVGISQRSVYCFVDLDGNILKAASWKAPAKHKRGSIFDAAYGWGKSVSQYGASYLR